MKRWYIYILECRNGHYYTGITDNLLKRYRGHLTGTSQAKYTRSFRPQRIAQCWTLVGDRGLAIRLECYIKSMSRKQKEKIVSNPGLCVEYVNQHLPSACDAAPVVEKELREIEFVAAGNQKTAHSQPIGSA